MTAATTTEPRAPELKHASARFGPNRAQRRCAQQGVRARCRRSRIPASTTNDYNTRPGLLFLNARHHNPALGAFVSVDPLVVQTGEPYAYGSANPVLFSDPDGLRACTSNYIAELGCGANQRLERSKRVVDSFLGRLAVAGI